MRGVLLVSATLLGLSAVASPESLISGRVVDSAGAPVAGASVKALAYRSAARAFLDRAKGVEAFAAGETKTDARGAFRLPAAGSGKEVSLLLTARGLPSVEIGGPFDQGGSDEDLEVSMPEGQKISGRVTDEQGGPVADARVRAQAALEFPEDSTAFEETRTGRDGSFSLPSAPKGDVTLRVFAAGFVPLAVASARSGQRVVVKRGGSVEGTLTDRSGKPVAGAVVVADEAAAQTNESGRYRIEALPEGLASLRASVENGDRVARRDAVRIRRGETAPADLVLAPETGIAGVVVDEKTRRPISRVRVEALDNPFPLPGMAPARQAKTDSRGRFRLVGLSRREYKVTASRRDYLGSTLPAVSASPPSGPLRIALVRGALVWGRAVDETGVALAGVRVRVLPGQGRRGMLRNRPTRAPAPSAVTLADGSFELHGLPPGEPLSIAASRAGYVAARQDGAAATIGKGKPLTLVLRRGNEARGRVVDGAGEVVSGAEVSLSRLEEHRVGLASWSGDDPDSIRNAVTDAEGRFVLKALEPGKYAARIKHPAYATTSIPALRVERSGVTQWDPFVLQPSAPVAGVVRNKKGEPVAGASVESYGADGGIGQAQSDVEGRFHLDGYGAGATFTLKVEADGYAPSRQSVKAPAPDLSIVLSTAAVLRGRVEHASTQQAVTDFAVGGRIPHGAWIETRDFRSQDGSFEISGVPAGKIMLTASAPGYLEGSLTGIEVAEGEVKEGVVVSLRKGRSISGRVLDPRRGTGVPNATLSWRRISEQDSSGFAVGPGGAFAMVSNAATTDADGRFQYDAVPPEKLIFKASHPDFLEAEKTVDASAESAGDITLAQGGSISGTVVAGDGRSPVSGAEVGLRESGAPPSALSGDQTRADESGGFRFEHLKEGRYRLTARGQAGRAASTEVVLTPGKSADGVVLELSAGATLLGRVTGLPPARLSGLEIQAHRNDYLATATTEPDGTFVLSDVPPGAVRVSAWTSRGGAGSRGVSKNIEVPEGLSEVPVELAFEGSSRLEVRVTRKDKPLPGIGLNVLPDPLFSPGMEVLAETDADGRAAFDGLPDGAYVLRGYPSQGASFSRPVAVSGDTSIEVALGASGSLSGTVTDVSSGEPLSDVSVAAETGQEISGWLVPRSRSDSQGRYVIDDLDPGSLQVTARRDGYRQKTLPVTIGDSPVELSFTLSRGGGLAVRASDGLTGLPLSGLWALAFADSGAMSFSGAVTLDAQGNGEVASLAPGTYSLYIFSTGYGPRTFSPVRVPSPPLAVSLTPGGSVEVRAESATVGRILDDNGMLYLSTAYRLDGRVSIAPPLTVWDHLAPGSYRLIVEGQGGGKTYSFAVTEGQTTRLEIR